MSIRKTILLFFIFLPFAVWSQNSLPNKEMQSAALAFQMSKYGYDNQKPIYLITAAQTLIDHPVKGDFVPLSVSDSLDTNAIKYKSKKQSVKLDPLKLLADARLMTDKKDTALIAMINTLQNSIPKDYEKKRGRKFSPLVQEYTIDSKSTKTLSTVFNGKEIAEVLIVGDGKSNLDLFVYDASGKLIMADTNPLDNCYISFTPKQTANYTIVVKNKGKTYNECMLMTN